MIKQRLLTSPIWVSQIDLAQRVTDVVPPERADGVAFTGARLLVRRNHIPLGYIELTPDEFSVEFIEAALKEQLGELATSVVDAEGSPGARQSDPFVSVVLCTRNRPEGAANAIAGLRNLDYDRFEIVVVDNAPSTDETFEIVRERFNDDVRVRYVREPRPGLSRARNRGVAESTGQIVAFTDDDVAVDPQWLKGIVRGFNRIDNVGCVTGLIPTAELENEVQMYFDRRMSWGASCTPRVFDLKEHRDNSPLYPYSPGIFGTGANFAMDRQVLSSLGGFNEALGAGTAAGGGEDLDVFMRTILNGFRLVYEPSAIISHIHRAELSHLQDQMYTYGSGLTASFTALIFTDRRNLFEIAKRVGVGVFRLRKIAKGATSDESLPPGLINQEFRGMTAGPLRYLEGCWALRRAA